MDRNFRNEFPESFCSMLFEPELPLEILGEWNVPIILAQA